MQISEQRDNLQELLNHANIKNKKTNFQNLQSLEREKDMRSYIEILEQRNLSLIDENSRLSTENLKLKKEMEDTISLKKQLENHKKDKKRLIELMRQSKEFRMLGFLSGDKNEICRLNSLGLFTDYDIDQIKLKKCSDLTTKTANRNFINSRKEIKKSGVRECLKPFLCLEEQLWVESDIYDFARQWRQDNKGNFTDQSIELLVFTLNTRFLSKIKAFRKSAHLFCKNCGGTPKTLKNDKLFSKINARMDAHTKTLKRFERSNFWFK